MDKSCTRCKDYVAHQYWDHMDNRKKRFFKLMLGNFRNGVVRSSRLCCSCGQIYMFYSLLVCCFGQVDNLGPGITVSWFTHLST